MRLTTPTAWASRPRRLRKLLRSGSSDMVSILAFLVELELQLLVCLFFHGQLLLQPLDFGVELLNLRRGGWLRREGGRRGGSPRPSRLALNVPNGGHAGRLRFEDDLGGSVALRRRPHVDLSRCTARPN